MLKKLRVKFVCSIMTVVTVMLCVIFALVYIFTSRGLELQSVQLMEGLIESPFASNIETNRSDDAQLPFFVVQIGLRGELIAVSGGSYNLEDEWRVLEITRAALDNGAQSGVLEEFGLRFLRKTRPAGIIFVFADMSNERTTIQNIYRGMLGIGSVSFLVFLGLSLLLANWAVKPVEKAWQQQRQFVADASHELKTPLTVIMTNAEMLQEPGYSDVSRQQFSDNILTMSHQMRGLVEGLLELARVDNGSVKTNFAELDLTQLVTETMLPFEPLYFEKNLELSSDIENDIQVQGSAAHLRQVLEILLDNAMKYSTPEGRVQVRLKCQGSHCLLSVASPGEEISPEDRKNIFKRFYRIDKARSRDGSYGLGLSIAQSIVQEHRGRIWVESEGGVNTFFVQLPA